MNYLKRGLAVAAVTALPLSLAALPAQAVPVPAPFNAPGTYNIDVNGTAPGGQRVSVVKRLVDDGGIAYLVRVDFGDRYNDVNGVRRVSVPLLRVYRPDETTENRFEDDGLDIHFDVRNHGTTIIQHVVRDNVDLDAGADDQWSFNPRNPVSDVNDTDLRVRVGTDGDGKGSSDWAYFVQPDTPFVP